MCGVCVVCLGEAPFFLSSCSPDSEHARGVATATLRGGLLLPCSM